MRTYRYSASSDCINVVLFSENYPGVRNVVVIAEQLNQPKTLGPGYASQEIITPRIWRMSYRQLISRPLHSRICRLQVPSARALRDPSPWDLSNPTSKTHASRPVAHGWTKEFGSTSRLSQWLTTRCGCGSTPPQLHSGRDALTGLGTLDIRQTASAGSVFSTHFQAQSLWVASVSE